MSVQSDILTQKKVMDVFETCVHNLTVKILEISEENKHDEEMAAIKIKRIIQKWFNNGGKI